MMPREIVSDGFISQTNRRRISPGTLTTLSISLILLFVLESRADTKHPPAHPVDLNAATAEPLQQVPGMGRKQLQLSSRGAAHFRGLKTCLRLKASRRLAWKKASLSDDWFGCTESAVTIALRFRRDLKCAGGC
jgi:hypothetical protein